MNPLVSVIVPIFGVEEYIEKCARSLFEQTLESIEFIFVDDCTKDNSIFILQEVINEYPNRKGQIKLLRNNTNSGLPTSRKRGVEVANGDYIIHCDSDDWVDVKMYETLYNKAVEEDADIVICDFKHIYNDGRQIVIPQKPAKKDGKSLIHQMLQQKLHGSCCNKLVKRACYKDGIVFPIKNMTEDLVVMTQVAINAKHISYIAEPYYYYRINTDSISKCNTESSILARYNGIIENTIIIADFIERNNLMWEFSEDIIFKKYDCKEVLDSLLNKFKYRELWRNTFPEINNLYLRNKYIKRNNKLRGFLLLNKMYFVYYIVINLKRYI